MTVVTLMFLLLTGSALQSLLPAVSWLGYATVPVLTAVVIYYSLYRGGILTLVVAILAGLFQDSLSLIPLGYSSFGFAAAVLVLERYRELVVKQSPLTHMVLTAVAHAAVTLALTLLLLGDGLVAWQPLWWLWKVPGAALLGLLAGPPVITVARLLEETTGLIEAEKKHETQRNFYGIR